MSANDGVIRANLAAACLLAAATTVIFGLLLAGGPDLASVAGALLTAFVATAVALAAAPLLRSGVRRLGLRGGLAAAVGAVALTAIAVLLVFAFAALRVAILGTGAHGVHASHGAASASGLEHALLEAALLAPVVAVVAIAGPALLRALAWFSPVRWWREVGTRRRRKLFPVTVATAGLIATMGIASAPAATAAIVPATPACTAESAVRAYDIAAVNVFIPYSRWGNDLGAPIADPVNGDVLHDTDGDPNGMIFVLQQDKAAVQNWYAPIVREADGTYINDIADGRRLRPRPLVLRANVGECIAITVSNELIVPAADPLAPAMGGFLPQVDPKIALHAFGISYNPADTGAAAGYSPDNSVGVGESATYYWVAPKSEGMYMFRDNGMPAGAADDGGGSEHGLYGALSVQPAGSRWFDPVTGRELSSSIPDQQYAAVADQSGDLYIDAVIVDQSQKRFRDSVLISQDVMPFVGAPPPVDPDEIVVPLERFGINFGSEPEYKRVEWNAERDEGVWCEDCAGEETGLSSWVYGDPGMVKLAGDPGPWLPETPDYGAEDPLARAGGLVAGNVEDCNLMLTTAVDEQRPASCYVANVTRAYQGDPIKLRFGHAGVYETHVFHLHAHTWPAEPDDSGPAGTLPPRPTPENQPRASTIDSKTYSPWTGFTADLNYGAGARIGTIGDSIFHCHLYTHFALGFWALMRVHDALEDGTNALPDGTRVTPWVPIADIAPDLGLHQDVPPPKNGPTFDIPGFPRFIPGEYGARAPQPPGSVWQREFDTVTKQWLTNPETGEVLEAEAMRLTGTTALDPAVLLATQDVVVPTGALSAVFTFAGENTQGITLPATTDQVKAELETLETIDVVEVTGSGTDADPWAIRLVAWRSTPDLTISVAFDIGDPVDATPSADYDPADPATVQTAFRLAQEQRTLEAFHASRNQGTAPQPGAPVVDPCPADARVVTYKASVIQMPLWYVGERPAPGTEDPLAPDNGGWRDVQGRIIVADEDVDDVLAGTKAPEPFFYRVNAGDCINMELTNRTPNHIGNDAYQSLIQTNMVGSHIHLVNFDVLASDGASNGWNYQQAAFTQTQKEFNDDILDGTIECVEGEVCLPDLPVDYDPVAESITPQNVRDNWLYNGQTIKERWFADYELRTVFNHDHHFAAAIQNRGLYSALIVEPEGFDSRDPLTGEWLQPLNSPRQQPAIVGGGIAPACGDACEGSASGAIMDLIGPATPPANPGAAWEPDDFREFGVSIADFIPMFTLSNTLADIQDVANAIAPPPLPTTSAIGDQGAMAINFKAEPIMDRQYVLEPPVAVDPGGLDENPVPITEEQLLEAGWVDPAYNFSSRIWGDPQTPVLKANRGDNIRFRLIQGSHEEMHNFTVHGLRWKNDPIDPASPYINARPVGVSEAFNIEDAAVDCGLSNTGECFRPPADGGTEPRVADFLFGGTGLENLRLGMWGILRVFDQSTDNPLLPLPDNSVAQPVGVPVPTPVTEALVAEFAPILAELAAAQDALDVAEADLAAAQADGATPEEIAVIEAQIAVIEAQIADLQAQLAPLQDQIAAIDLPVAAQNPSCPTGAPVKTFDVSAINLDIPYNQYGDHDPYGLAYVLTSEADAVRANPALLEPLVLRVNEGDCIQVTLRNDVDWTLWNEHRMLGTLDGDAPLPLEPVWPLPVVADEPPPVFEPAVPWIAGQRVSLHPSLLRYDVRSSDGATVGYNFDQTAGPGDQVQYTWYADEVVYADPNAAAALTDGELGVVPLTSFGDVRGHRHHGLLASLVVGPRGATFHDPITGVAVQTGAQVDVRPAGDGSDYRDAVVMHHNGLNLRNPESVQVRNVLFDPIPTDWPDMGERAINYKNAPLHHRLGLPHPLVDLTVDPPVDPLGPPFNEPDFGERLANVFSTTFPIDPDGDGPLLPQPIGDPETPIIRAYQGDPLRIHVVQTADRARLLQYSVAGHNWLEHAFDAGSVRAGVQGSIGTGGSYTFHMEAAGGDLQAVGDYRYGVENGVMGLSSGSWGLVRVYQHPAPGTERVLVPIEQCQNPFLGCNPLRVINEDLTPEPGAPALGVTAVPDLAEVGDTVQIEGVLRLGDAPIGAGHEVTFTWNDGGPQTQVVTTGAGGAVSFPLTINNFPPGHVLDVLALATVSFTDGRPDQEVRGGVQIYVIDPDDETAPTVTEVIPENGATGLVRTTAVTVRFSERIDTATLEGAIRLVRASDGTEIPVTVTESYAADIRYSVVTLTPTGILPSGEIRVEVDDAVSDYAGIGLEEQFTSVFTTVATLFSRLAGPDRFVTAVEISKAQFPQGADTVYIAQGMNFPDALAGAPAAAADGAPILLVSSTIPSATVNELIRLNPTNIKVLGGPGAVSDDILNALRLRVGATGTVERLAGADRYVTAAAISQATFPTTANRVYIASGADFPDALSGAAVAAQVGAPVLLTTPGALSSVTQAELLRLAPSEIVILGGPGAVAPAVATQIRAATGITAERLQGPSRYETAVAISQASFEDGPIGALYVATGGTFPDALAAAPVAGLNGAPLLLLPPGTLPIPAAVIAEVQRLDPAEIRVLGGTGAVSDAQLNALRRALGLPIVPLGSAPPAGVI